MIISAKNHVTMWQKKKVRVVRPVSNEVTTCVENDEEAEYNGRWRDMDDCAVRHSGPTLSSFGIQYCAVLMGPSFFRCVFGHIAHA